MSVRFCPPSQEVGAAEENIRKTTATQLQDNFSDSDLQITRDCLQPLDTPTTAPTTASASPLPKLDVLPLIQWVGELKVKVSPKVYRSRLRKIQRVKKNSISKAQIRRSREILSPDLIDFKWYLVPAACD